MSDPTTSIATAVAGIALKACAKFKLYPHFSAKVVSQNDDGTLELRPDSTFIGGLSKVKLRAISPGFLVKVPANTQCLFIFENGDRKRPVATWFDSSIGRTSLLSVTATDAVGFGTVDPSHLVLGEPLMQVLAGILSQLEEMATDLSTHTHLGNLGAPTSPPATAASYVAWATYFENSATSFSEEVPANTMLVEWITSSKSKP